MRSGDGRFQVQVVALGSSVLLCDILWRISSSTVKSSVSGMKHWLSAIHGWLGSLLRHIYATFTFFSLALKYLAEQAIGVEATGTFRTK